ncbi:MAG: hypothetical protein HZA78_12400 [Candidatus Schekmanbacteria bacterium]|nr:hypothetical protein [Candidatus Schekmanbacteria bacterium]
MRTVKNYNKLASASSKQKTHPKQKKSSSPELDNLSFREKQVLALVRKEGMVTNKMLQQEFKISHGTAHKFLSQLANKQILQATGKSRSVSYVLSG